MSLSISSSPRIPVFVFADAAARAACATMITGDIAYQTDTAKNYVYSGAAWVDILAGVTADFVKIESKTPAAAATVDFTTGISGYNYLMLVFNLVGSAAAGNQGLLTVNNDAGANYNYCSYDKNATWAVTAAANNFPIGGLRSDYGVCSNNYIIAVNALSTSNEHGICGDIGGDVNAPGAAVFGHYRSASAITRVTITPSAGTITGTATLYGLKS